MSKRKFNAKQRLMTICGVFLLLLCSSILMLASNKNSFAEQSGKYDELCAGHEYCVVLNAGDDVSFREDAENKIYVDYSDGDSEISFGIENLRAYSIDEKFVALDVDGYDFASFFKLISTNPEAKNMVAYTHGFMDDGSAVSFFADRYPEYTSSDISGVYFDFGNEYTYNYFYSGPDEMTIEIKKESDLASIALDTGNFGSGTSYWEMSPFDHMSDNYVAFRFEETPFITLNGDTYNYSLIATSGEEMVRNLDVLQFDVRDTTETHSFEDEFILEVHDRNSDWSVRLESEVRSATSHGQDVTGYHYFFPEGTVLPDGGDYVLAVVPDFKENTDSSVYVEPDSTYSIITDDHEDGYVTDNTSTVVNQLQISDSRYWDTDEHKQYFKNGNVVINEWLPNMNRCIDPSGGEGYCLFDEPIDVFDSENSEDSGYVYIGFASESGYRFDDYVIVNDVKYEVPIDYNDPFEWNRYRTADGFNVVGFTLRVKANEAGVYNIAYHLDEYEPHIAKFGLHNTTSSSGVVISDNASIEIKDFICASGYKGSISVIDAVKTADMGALEPCMPGNELDPTGKYVMLTTVAAPAEVVLEILPDRGYQIKALNEYVVPKEEVGSFGLRGYSAGLFTLGEEMERSNDEVLSKTELVGSGTLAVSDADIEHGTGRLTVEQNDPSDATKEAFAGLAGDEALAYFDFNLTNIIYDGKGSFWILKELHDPSENVEVELVLKEGLVGEDVKLLHELDDGSIELVPVVYKAETNSIAFSADSFSNYALTVNEEAMVDTESSSEDTPNTLDKMPTHVIVFVSAMIILVIALKVNKNKEEA